MKFADSPAPYTAEWWNSEEIRHLKFLALRRSNGFCERCGRLPERRLMARMKTTGFRKADQGEALGPEDFEAVCETCLAIQRGRF